MIEIDRNIEIMGIINLTDDSYFADSRCYDVDAALKRVAALLADGADIIDVGACSTRPGAERHFGNLRTDPGAALSEAGL